MKVLYLTYNFNSGSGWGRLSKELITRLIKRGIKAEILTEAEENFPASRNFLRRSWRVIPAALKARKFVKNADIIHSMEGNPYSIIAYLASLGLNRKKKIITATGAYSVRPLYRKSTEFIIKRAYKDADRVVCISSYIQGEIKRKVPLCKTEIINLGVDFERFSGQRKTSPIPFILSVGNVGRRKGYHISIPAFIEVAKKIPNINYYIAGRIDNNFFNECQRIIKDNNLENRIIFLGPQNDEQLKNLYLSAELFLLTSVNYVHHFEGFGLVFLEAAAAGLPVIGTLDNGIEDAVKNNINGFLVPQNDIKATADAIIKIITDGKIKNDFSYASIKWAEQNSWEKVAEKYWELYVSLTKP